MKKLFFATIVVSTVLSVMTHVGAADLNANEKGIVNFSENFSTLMFEDEYDSYFSYRVTNKNGDICSYGQTEENNGNVSFSFKIKGETGEYTLVLSNRKVGKKTYTISYVSNLYNDFNEVKALEDEKEMDMFLNDNGSDFGFDTVAYSMLDESEKNKVIEYFLTIDDLVSMEDMYSASDDVNVTNRLFKSTQSSSKIVQYISQTYKSDGMQFNNDIGKVFVEDLTNDNKLLVAQNLAGKSIEQKLMEDFALAVLKARVSQIVYYMDMEQIIYSNGNIWGFYENDLNALYNADTTAVYKEMKDSGASITSLDAYRKLLSKLIYENPLDNRGYPDVDNNTNGSAVVGSGNIIFSVEYTQGNSPFPKDIKIDAVTSYETALNINFMDLGGYDWAKESINKLVENYIVNGISNQEFRPGVSVTREEFVKMITAGLRLTGAEAVVTFADVSDNDWFYSYVAAAQRAGIVYGDDNNNFGVGNNITRQEAAVMIQRAMEYAEWSPELGETVSFTDSDEVSAYAKGAVSKLARAGIISGMADGSFRPQASITRAEAAKMLYEFLYKANMLTW